MNAPHARIQWLGRSIRLYAVATNEDLTYMDLTGQGTVKATPGYKAGRKPVLAAIQWCSRNGYQLVR